MSMMPLYRAVPLPEIEVLRGWIKNLDGGPELWGNAAARLGLQRYRDALVSLPLEQREDESAKLARLDKTELLLLLTLLMGINAPDRGNDAADIRE